MSVREQVADSWRCGVGYRRPWTSSLWTDGQQVWSYLHPIGRTERDGSGTGLKIAVDCHFSKTTVAHCNALKQVADRAEPCQACASGEAHGKQEAS